MGRFLLSRLTSALFVMVGVSCLVFLLIHLVPGDPVEVMLGELAQAGDRVALRAALGLDQALPLQLLHYLTGLVTGDLGQSFHSHRPVVDLLRERIPATVELAGAALAIALLVAIPLGVTAARWQGSYWDRGSMAMALLGLSLPNFWLGPLLILLFSVELGWLPVSGHDGLTSLVLPAITLGTGMAAILARMVRAALLDVLGEDYMRTARAKGLSATWATWRHGLPNAALPIVTLVGLQLGALLGGAVITETVFSWPGLGSLVVDAINRRDYPVVQGAVLVISLTYVAVNTLTDLLYAWLDPRLRLEEKPE